MPVFKSLGSLSLWTANDISLNYIRKQYLNMICNCIRLYVKRSYITNIIVCIHHEFQVLKPQYLQITCWPLFIYLCAVTLKGIADDAQSNGNTMKHADYLGITWIHSKVTIYKSTWTELWYTVFLIPISVVLILTYRWQMIFRSRSSTLKRKERKKSIIRHLVCIPHFTIYLTWLFIPQIMRESFSAHRQTIYICVSVLAITWRGNTNILTFSGIRDSNIHLMLLWMYGNVQT